MMVLRRGRPTQLLGSTVGVDVSYELEPATAGRHGRHEPWRPPLEVYEIASELVVRVEIAGLSADQIEIQIVADELAIRGERPLGPCADARLFHESRLRYGPFLAGVRLPFPVDANEASAEYVDGLLTVRLPRLAPTRIAMPEQPAAPRGGEGER
jgi:HSP20 family protein